MRSTLIIGVLFIAAVAVMMGSYFLQPAIDRVVERIGSDRAGKAIIPPHLDEETIRRKAQSNRPQEQRTK